MVSVIILRFVWFLLRSTFGHFLFGSNDIKYPFIYRSNISSNHISTNMVKVLFSLMAAVSRAVIDRTNEPLRGYQSCRPDPQRSSDPELQLDFGNYQQKFNDFAAVYEGIMEDPSKYRPEDNIPEVAKSMLENTFHEALEKANEYERKGDQLLANKVMALVGGRFENEFIDFLRGLAQRSSDADRQREYENYRAEFNNLATLYESSMKDIEEDPNKSRPDDVTPGQAKSMLENIFKRARDMAKYFARQGDEELAANVKALVESRFGNEFNHFLAEHGDQ